MDCKSPVFRFDDVRVDVGNAQILKSGEPLAVEPKALRVLVYLLENPGRLIEKDEFLKAIWPETFVTENALTREIALLRKALGDRTLEAKYIETVPRRGYRFIFPITTETPKEQAITVTNRGALARRWQVVVPAAGILALAIGAWFFLRHKTHALKETDTVVLTDFTNQTGDPVFDETLRQGLAVQLAQSPFLNILSDQKTRDALKLMGHAAGERLTPELARDLCQRTESKAYLSGSITSLGTQFVIGLSAMNCQTGDSLAQEQVRAQSKEEVLIALDLAASRLRQKLGESLSSVQKFDTPLPEVTTSSLEALKAYTLGRKAWYEKQDMEEAGALLKHAIELDPNFALAYASLGTFSSRSGYPGFGREYIKKAFELRDRVSPREKLAISATYYLQVTGQLEEAFPICQLWERSYPRDAEPRFVSADVYFRRGQPEKSLLKVQEAVALDPGNAEGIANLMGAYVNVNRFEEAKATYDKALRSDLDSGTLHMLRYYIADLEKDTAEMKRQLAWPNGRPNEEDGFLGFHAATEARRGRLNNARELSRRGMKASERDGMTEEAAGFPTVFALWDADFGESQSSRRDVSTALALAQSREVQLGVTLALARVGDSARAQALAEKLHEQYSLDTTINFYWLPLIRAAIEINRGNPNKAIELLQSTEEFDLAGSDLYVFYLRGEAFRLAHRGGEAAAEFQKILDHRGSLAVSTLDSLVRLGLARAYVLQGDTPKARTAYRDFLALWKDADLDIPILKTAKAEYAKLQ